MKKRKRQFKKKIEILNTFVKEFKHFIKLLFNKMVTLNHS